MSGARLGNTPSSPSYIGRATKSAASSRTARSGVTTTHWMPSPVAMGLLHLRGHALGLLRRFFDAADVQEGALGQLVPLAVAQLLEAADRLLEGRHLAGLVG